MNVFHRCFPKSCKYLARSISSVFICIFDEDSKENASFPICRIWKISKVTLPRRKGDNRVLDKEPWVPGITANCPLFYQTMLCFLFLYRKDYWKN